MQRFYLEDLETSNYSFVLKDSDLIHQIWRVLRSKPGDKIILFDWKDLWDYVFEIKDIKKTEIFLEQVDRIEKKSEIDFELNLFQAIPNKMDKIEDIIKNWTQIWITNFLFFRANRSQKLIISDKKIERLNKIIKEAAEQCGRNIIPWLIIWEKPNFINLSWDNYFLHTKSPLSNSLLKEREYEEVKILKNIKIDSWKIINLFIGPEWWFDDDEVWRFWKNDFKSLYLWERILRTELAWISSAFYLIQNNL